MTEQHAADPAPVRRWLVPLAVLLFATALSPVWTAVDARDAWQAVYFESQGGPSTMLVGDPLNETMVPHVFVDTDGALQVPEGRTVALPLDRPLRISRQGGGLPLVAIARRTGDRLEGAVSLGEGGIAPFDPDRPWRTEALRLESIGAGCGDGPLRVEPGPGARLSFGTCSWTQSDADTLVVLGADRWKAVVGEGERFVAERRLRLPALGPALALAVLAGLTLAWAFGAGASLSTSIVAAGLALLAPHLGPLIAVVAGCVGVLGSVARLGARLGGKLLAAALLLGGVALANPGGGTVLVGYSTVEGDGLRPDGPEPGGILQATCPDVGNVNRVAQAGGTIDWLSGELCSGAAGPGSRVVMLGGTNDDFIWGMRAGGLGGHLALLLAGLQASLSDGTWTPAGIESFFDRAAARSLRAADEQRAAYEAAARCSTDGGGSFLLAQNFVIQDLRAGRGEDRTALVSERFAGVDAGGGTSIDLLERVGDRAALSWFADNIHLTAVGHAGMGQAICEARR